MEREKAVYVSGECPSMATAATSDVFHSPQLAFLLKEASVHLPAVHVVGYVQPFPDHLFYTIPCAELHSFWSLLSTASRHVCLTLQSSGLEGFTSTTTTQLVLPEQGVARTNADALDGTDSRHGRLHCVLFAELQLAKA